MDRIVIIDITASKLEPFEKLGFRTMKCNIQDIQTKEWMGLPQYHLQKPRFYVSPANSLGYMDGGIDRAYMGMFDDIQARVQKCIRSHKIMSLTGIPYLPIGSAIIVKADEDNDYLIAAPTMLMPQPIRTTENPYWAMRAILKVWTEYGTLIVPPLGCGYGCVKPEDAARMMKKAVDDHIFTGPRKDTSHYIHNLDLMKQQPKYYDNTEFFDIPAEEVINMDF